MKIHLYTANITSIMSLTARLARSTTLRTALCGLLFVQAHSASAQPVSERGTSKTVGKGPFSNSAGPVLIGGALTGSGAIDSSLDNSAPKVQADAINSGASKVNINWFPWGSGQSNAAQSYVHSPNTFVVGCHGSPGRLYSPDGSSMPIKTMVQAILHDQAYKPGMPILLITCSGADRGGIFGQSVAQIIATKTGSPVTSCLTTTYWTFDPDLPLDPDPVQSGKHWPTFYPR